MRPLLISLVLSVLSDSATISAQPLFDTAANKPGPMPPALNLKLGNFFDYSLPKTDSASIPSTSVGVLAPAGIDSNRSSPRPGWLKKLTIESFGYGPAPLEPAFDLSPGYTAALFNLYGLECPGCARGPVNWPQLTLPPFGANVTWKLRDGRVELFTGAGGIEAWRPTSTFMMNDAWLTQVQVGGRVAIDHSQRLWFGGTGRYLYNLGPGPGPKHWNTFGGDATFRFGQRRIPAGR